MVITIGCDENRRLLRMLGDAREHHERLKHDSEPVPRALREAEMVVNQLKAKQQEHAATCPILPSSDVDGA
jgi:hypothetical protein